MCQEQPVAEDSVVRMQIAGRDGAIAETVRRLDGAGVAIEDITTRRPTLDDVFLVLTGHAAEPDADEEGEGEEKAA